MAVTTTRAPERPPAVALAPPVAVAGVSNARRALRQFLRNRPAVIGVCVVVLWAVIALLAPLIAPYDPTDQDVKMRLQGPSLAHWFGVDGLGRDVFSRVLYGGRVSLPVAAVVVLIAATFGTLLGGLGGFVGGWLDEGAMRLVDIVLAFPSLILALAIAAALGPSIQNSMLAMLIVWWPPYARLVRGQVLGLKRRDYVTAARAVGLHDRRILLRHVLPNAIGVILVLMTMDFGTAIIITAALSFLGVGAVPPTPEWGAMVSEGRELMAQWWIAAFPGLAIFSVAIACNFIGDGLHDAIDPHLRVR
ncbi:MAG: ABC transporter permease [Chloroflexi bacterium]|nr:ABC transporter permease [Chloroflexota bacterium]